MEPRLMVFIILSVFLAALSSPVLGQNPTLTECRPHIEATIRDLAARAVDGHSAPQQPPPPPAQPAYQPPAQPAYQPPPRAAVPQHHDYQAPSKPQIGFFNGLINSFFNIPPEPEQRDPKWNQPWNTHPEFKKKKKQDSSTVEKIDTRPGVISTMINKYIALIFGASPNKEMDPKWAQPWQTHPEFKRAPKEAVKVDNRPGVISSFLNNIIGKVFGIPQQEEERDPKWTQPWQTHTEFKRTTVPKETVIVDKRPGVISSFINDMIGKAFGLPKQEERDPKWAQPWQTHDEFKKKASKEPVIKRDPSAPGIISKFLNRLVLLAFKESEGGRDSKWAQPWQTHKEHTKKPKAPSKDTKKEVQQEGVFGFTFVNSFVYMLFGKSDVVERDPKWAEPWQTHQVRQQGAPAPAPKFSYMAPPTPEPYIPTGPVYRPPDYKAQTPEYKSTVPEYKPPTPAPKPVEVPAAKPIEAPAPKKVEIPVEAPKPVEVPVHKPAVQPEEQKFPSDSKDKPKTEDAPSHPADRVADVSKAPVKPVLEEVAPKKQERKEKIVEDEEQIVVVPSTLRKRDHIDSILGLDDSSMHASARTDPIDDATLRDLKKVYETSVKPLETTYKYQDISNRHISDAELFGTPMVLLLGPYSTGKSTFINYLLGQEYTKRALKTGTPPSLGAFRIVQYGEYDRDLDGTDLSGHWSFSSLQKFGQNFVDQIKGKALNDPLLKKVTFVEVPGILEMRRPGERLYPFNDVVQWFIDRADLILVMFDYTKLDAGYELEAILDQLKGRESQTRILLNKADQVPPEELIKVQGSLFWNLSPLLGVNSPPIVYAGSFASLPYRPGSPVKLFQAQEEALLHDIAKAVNSRVDNRVAIARRHAVRVRNHAQMVDTYLSTFYRNKGFLTSNHKLAEDIVENPHSYNIYEGMSLLTNISRYDLPDAEVYRDFFRIHNLYEFNGLREGCSYLGGCPLDKIDSAINKQLPELLTRHRKLVDAASPSSRLPRPSMRGSDMGAGAAQAHANKL